MVREEYFTSLTKLGPKSKEYYTSLLISRVYSIKTLKTLVTPCFPQLVNITGLAKNYGKLINENM
jgi:hypothetical protein